MMRYRTASGSTVKVVGAHAGIVDILFDWIEEGACIEANPVAEISDPGDAILTWWCDCCGAGNAALVAA